MRTLYEIKNLDCKNKDHRMKLLLFVMLILKLKEKPSKDDLRVYCKKLKKKYNVEVKFYNKNKYLDENCFVIKTNDDYVLTCFYDSAYEAMLKFISFIYFLSKDKKLKRVT